MSAMIEVKNVSKKYLKKTGASSSYKTVREAIVELPSKILHPSAAASKAIRQDNDFWALKDINFTVNEGDVLGIIGRNGAGKSTLLKIISQITAPTSGEIIMHGRVGSLLEVGTGFHPELTGRENIFLNGAILGMSRAEILKKFDEIVDFAGVEEFIDVPIKRYSSGMRMRLAFAVAAHLDPEILIIDEVLAVGDAQFQKKCLGKMKDVSKSGRTVLFVSHNMSAVQALCNRAIFLNDGHIVMDDTVNDVMQNYFQTIEKSSGDLNNVTNRRGDQAATIANVDIKNTKKGQDLHTFCDAEIKFRIRKNCGNDLGVLTVDAVIKTFTGAKITKLNTAFYGHEVIFKKDTIEVSLLIKELPLMPGAYILDCAIASSGVTRDMVEDVITFDINESNIYGTGKMPYAKDFIAAFHAKWTS